MLYFQSRFFVCFFIFIIIIIIILIILVIININIILYTLSSYSPHTVWGLPYLQGEIHTRSWLQPPKR